MSDSINLKIMKNCGAKYKELKNPEKTHDDIASFCKSLRAGKVKGSLELFQSLPKFVQCLILNYSWKVLINRYLNKGTLYSDESYLTAYQAFKLFKNKELRESKPFNEFYEKKDFSSIFKKAVEYHKNSKSGTSSSRTKKVFDKDLQKKETPSDTDPLYVFYTSLYSENPKSKLAIKWLTENGVFDDEDREELVKKYRKYIKDVKSKDNKVKSNVKVKSKDVKKKDEDDEEEVDEEEDEKKSPKKTKNENIPEDYVEKDISIKDYYKENVKTSKSILVKGEKTKEKKFFLTQLGGKWNRTLSGWIFPSKQKQKVVDLFKEDENEDEENVKENENLKKVQKTEMKTTLENGPEKIPKMGAIKPTYTITFGDQGENHAGMQKIGKMASEGFSLKDLQKTKKKFEELGAECELIHLNDYLDVEVPGLKADDAYVLIIRKGGDFIMQEEEKISNGANAIFVEQTGLQPDKKALMRGRVVNKRARYNLCFDEKGQKANYEKGQGTVIAYYEVPYLKALQEALSTYFGSKAENMIAEGNYYYDPSICGIGFHGDSERRKVIALRLGSKMNMQYQWFLRSKPIGQRFEFFLKNGDMYVMSEKAVGTDWKSRSKLTLRHAAGCPSFTTIESSPFELGVDDQSKKTLKT